MPTKIEWTDETWNPVSGCTKVSDGCRNCYAERMAKRLAGRHGYPADEPFRVTLHRDRLERPLCWRNPRRVFVCSMGDLFHSSVGWDVIEYVFMVMTNKARQHTYQILTKRPERMREFVSQCFPKLAECSPHVWLGVTAENQRTADDRIPVLLQTPAAVRFVSVEPMLESVFIQQWMDEDIWHGGSIGSPTDGPQWPRLDWVICGGETGPRARPMHPDWVRSLRDQCQAADIPFFFKHWGEWKGISGKSPQEVTDFQQFSRGRVCQIFGSPLVLWRIGKKHAGRSLDGEIWEQCPEVEYGKRL